MKCWKSLLKVTRVSHHVIGRVRNSTDWQRNKGLSHLGWTSKVCSLLTISALVGDTVLVHHSSDFPVKSKLCISHVKCVAYRIYRYLYHKVLWYKNTGFNPNFNVFWVCIVPTTSDTQVYKWDALLVLPHLAFLAIGSFTLNSHPFFLFLFLLLVCHDSVLF